MKKNSTLLLVDDLAQNIDILLELLCEYDLIPALDGQSALDIATSEDIDLILLDIMMPLMDGFEVCKRLKQDPRTADIPIIFLSAKNHYTDVQRGFALGGVDYVSKPFNPDELKARVTTHLQLRAYQKDLQEQVLIELEKNRLKEQLLFQQSKQAALGELLVHIAHQWKQPLASLGSINTIIRAKLEASIDIPKEQYLHYTHEAQTQIEFMSNTIETFRDFYQPTIREQEFYLSECLEDVLALLHASFEFESIKLEVHTTAQKSIHANKNEIAHILFSILTNMRDIFRLRQTLHPKITCHINGNSILLEDNAGGIENDNFEAIFEKYMSTHSSSGIGLYLSKNIAKKNHAYLRASNSMYGAQFTLGFTDA
ncbi:MAG: hybrid sensor histidine kinase/response regulator [Helicobacteraceae bacterium]|nr:hybrid sensor histidine kinase/response regulator [Helicobacteraceae bacterium]